MMAMSSEHASFRRVTSTTSRIVESYCDDCGTFIAASPSLCIVIAIEQLHHCPPSQETRITREQLELLMKELGAREPSLLAWLESSARNRRWFRADPLTAIRAAGLGLDEKMLAQLDLITRSIAFKIRSVF